MSIKPPPLLSVWPWPPFWLELGTLFVHFAFEALARSWVTRVPVIVGTGLQLPPAPGIPDGREASPPETEPSSPPPSDPLPPDELVLPEPLEPPDEPEPDVEPRPEEDVNPLPDEEPAFAPELAPDEDAAPELEVDPPPDDDELGPDPPSEEPHAAPSTTPMARTSEVGTRLLLFIPLLLCARV